MQRPGGLLQQRNQQQGRRQRVQRPGGQLQTEGDADDVIMGEAEAASLGVQRPEGLLQQPPDAPMQDAAGGDDSHATWLAGQMQLMLDDAVGIADEEGRTMLQPEKDQLRQQFSARFRRGLEAERSPPEREVRDWLREQLGIPRLSYDGTYEEEGEQGPPVPTPPTQSRQQQQQQQHQQQQQQQRQQQQQQQQQLSGPPLRRSDRINKGQVGAEYDATHGTVMGCSSSRQFSGRGGKGSRTPHSAPGSPQVATPAAAPSPRTGRGRGKKRK
jgi:hypothetical protein